MKQKVLVIVGPTASGKSKLAIDLAIKFNGEVISADSRQVYRGLDIGTEKVTDGEKQGIVHHLIDVANPDEIFTVKDFVDKASSAIEDISKRGKLPIIAGGTGFYIDALIYGIQMPEVPANTALRTKLEEKDEVDLFSLLLQKDPRRAATIDPHNKRRLIRALEVIEALGKVPENKERVQVYDGLIFGIKVEDDDLNEKIEKRLLTTCEKGLVDEVRELNRNGLSWQRLDELGLEYRIASKFIRNEISDKEMYTKMVSALKQYAKRQKTWFKRDENIQWINFNEKEKVYDKVDAFLK